MVAHGRRQGGTHRDYFQVEDADGQRFLALPPGPGRARRGAGLVPAQGCSRERADRYAEFNGQQFQLSARRRPSGGGRHRRRSWSPRPGHRRSQHSRRGGPRPYPARARRYVVASRLDLVDGPSVPAPGPRRLAGCRLLSLGKRRTAKEMSPSAAISRARRRPPPAGPAPARPDAVFTGHLDRFSALFEGNAGSPGICFTAARIAPGWLIWPNWRAAIARPWWRPARSITMSPSGAPCRMF